jgi:hypothetical protein
VLVAFFEVASAMELCNCARAASDDEVVGAFALLCADCELGYAAATSFGIGLFNDRLFRTPKLASQPKCGVGVVRAEFDIAGLDELS